MESRVYMGWFSPLLRQNTESIRVLWVGRERGMDLGAFEVARKCGCVVSSMYLSYRCAAGDRFARRIEFEETSITEIGLCLYVLR